VLLVRVPGTGGVSVLAATHKQREEFMHVFYFFIGCLFRGDDLSLVDSLLGQHSAFPPFFGGGGDVLTDLGGVMLF